MSVQVKIEDIPDSGLHLDEPLPAAFIDEFLPDMQELHARGDGRAVLDLTKSDDRVVVSGRATVPIGGECAFCLKPLAIDLAAKFSLVLFKAEEAPAQDGEDDEANANDAADVGVGEFDGKVVQVSDIVREQLLLSLEIAPKCRPDCKGLCPQCGVDRNTTACECKESQIDPRWEKLRLLKT